MLFRDMIFARQETLKKVRVISLCAWPTQRLRVEQQHHSSGLLRVRTHEPLQQCRVRIQIEIAQCAEVQHGLANLLPKRNR